MLQSIKHWLFMLFHFHEWEHIDQGEVQAYVRGKVETVGRWHLQKCKHCGKLQRKQFEA
jgi:hypothetical protein